MDGSEAVAQDILRVNGLNFVKVLRQMSFRRIVAQYIIHSVPDATTVLIHSQLEAIPLLLGYQLVLGNVISKFP